MQRNIASLAQRATCRTLQSGYCFNVKSHTFQNGTIKRSSLPSRHSTVTRNGTTIVTVGFSRRYRSTQAKRREDEEDDYGFQLPELQSNTSYASKDTGVPPVTKVKDFQILRSPEKLQSIESSANGSDAMLNSVSRSPTYASADRDVFPAPAQRLQDAFEHIQFSDGGVSVEFNAGFSSLEPYLSEDADQVNHVGHHITLGSSEHAIPQGQSYALKDRSVFSQDESKIVTQSIVRNHLKEKWHIPAQKLKGKHDRSEYAFRKGHTPRPRAETTETINFRGDLKNVPRLVTKLFLEQVYYLLANPDISSDVLDHAIGAYLFDLSRVLGQAPNALKVDLLDVYANAWVLAASPEQSLRRIKTLERYHEATSKPPVPLWVITQMLRSPALTTNDIQQVIICLRKWKHCWHWPGEAALIIFIRLMRHARVQTARYHEPITALLLELIPLAFAGISHAINTQRTLSEWCETALKLIAIDTAFHAFRESIHQQVAQLLVLEFMEAHEPPIMITRTGYKALSKVQVKHKKIPAEIFAAQVQKVTWPPWEERTRMGLAVHDDYVDVKSRTLIVLQRMQEAGFALDDYDWANHIVGGRDTDQSPTIQTRRSGVEGWASPSTEDGPRTWAARVTATRSVREAWMTFCAFDAAVLQKEIKHGVVYEAMLQKLTAPPVKLPVSPDSNSLPGDGIEVYPDPELPRDQVYISRPVPSVTGFIDEIAMTGVPLTGRMLSTMLWFCPDFELGRQYISMSRLTAKEKDILCNPRKYSIRTIVRTLESLPESIQEGYMRMVSSIPRKGSGTSENVHFRRLYLKGPKFGALILESMSRASDRLRASFLSAFASNDKLHSANLCRYFSLGMPREDQSCTSLSRSEITNILFEIQRHTSWGMREQIELPHGRGTLSRPADLIKDALTSAMPTQSEIWTGTGRLSGDRTKDSYHVAVALPYVSGDTVEAILWIYAAAYDKQSVPDILDLLQRLSDHNDHVIERSTVSTRNVCAVRVILEGLWLDKAEGAVRRRTTGSTILHATAEQLAEAKQYCERFAFWPNDEQVLSYCRDHKHGRKKVTGMKELHIYRTEALKDRNRTERQNKQA